MRTWELALHKYRTVRVVRSGGLAIVSDPPCVVVEDAHRVQVDQLVLGPGECHARRTGASAGAQPVGVTCRAPGIDVHDLAVTRR